MFNPFEKNIESIESNDLNKLIDNAVSEGWYIEYKSNFISSKKISHSVASFANSDGGWLFIGIIDNESNTASKICGFNLSEHPQPIEKIRDIIKNNITPIPQFDIKLLNTCENNYVLIIMVEKGLQAPYITKDGCIYRRVAAGSDPIPENDRYSLQKLFERNEEFNRIVESFSSNVLTMSKFQAEANQTFIEAYFYIYPFNNFTFKNFYEKFFIDELYEFFNSPLTFIAEPMTANISFNSFQSSKDSYMLRSFSDIDQIINITLTVEIFENGNCKLLIPLSEYLLSNIETVPERFLGSETLIYMFEKLKVNPLQYIKIRGLTSLARFCMI
jgi:hypothetical protein